MTEVLLTNKKQIYENMRKDPELKEISDEELLESSEMMAEANADPNAEWHYMFKL